MSYVDTCAMGVNVDTGAIPDFDTFLDCLGAGFDEVLALAGGRPQVPHQRPTPGTYRPAART